MKSYTALASPEQLILVVLIQFVVLVFVHSLGESSQVVGK